MFTILVCGDRWWSDYNLVLQTLRRWHTITPITQVVHGACRGADLMGERAARELGVAEVVGYPALWDVHGVQAGPIRNRLMLQQHPEIDLVVAFHDTMFVSKGTKDMVRIALGSGKLVELVRHDEEVFPYGQ